MFRIGCVSTVVSVLLLGLFQVGAPTQAQTKYVPHRMIHLNPTGPRPEALTVKVGMPIVWQSHLAHTKSVVVTVAFLKGATVAQATQPVEGMNGFVLEDGQFVGRIEGNGGTVALTFTAPGEYTYALGHGDALTGAVTVQP